MPEPESEWLPVLLGDVRVGDAVRTIPNRVPSESRFRFWFGTIVGVRSGSVLVQNNDDTVSFFPHQLERMERPE